METKPIKLVLAEDVAALLDALGLSAQMRAGEIRCISCGRIVSEEDVSKIEATGSGYAVTCSAPACTDSLNQRDGRTDAQR